MRKIKIKTWKAEVPVFSDDGKIIGTKEEDENLLIAFNNLIGSKRPEEIPRGLDKFRLFNKLSKAFSKAEETKILQLEDAEYEFLKGLVENDIPSSWGMNENLFKAFNLFLEAKEEN